MVSLHLRREALYNAITSGELGKKIRTLPFEANESFREGLQTLRLPEKEKYRVRFLDEIGNLATRVLEPSRPAILRANGLMEKEYASSTIQDELETIRTKILLVRKIADISLRSSHPHVYAQFLSRPGLDIEKFLASMGFFAGDRRVHFKVLKPEVRKSALEMEHLARKKSIESLRALFSMIWERSPEVLPGINYPGSRSMYVLDIMLQMVRNSEALAAFVDQDYDLHFMDNDIFSKKLILSRVNEADENSQMYRNAHDYLISLGIHLNDDGKIIRFGKMFKHGPLEGYVVLAPEKLRRYGYEGFTSGDVKDRSVILATETESLVQHELEHVLDKTIFVECIMPDDDPEHPERELDQNLLGMEVRGRLAEMAFSRDLQLIEESMKEVRENCALSPEKYEKDYDMRIRVAADQIVLRKLRRLKKGTSLQVAAREQLDHAYLLACRLTYSRIICPFTVAKKSPAQQQPQQQLQQHPIEQIGIQETEEL